MRTFLDLSHSLKTLTSLNKRFRPLKKILGILEQEIRSTRLPPVFQDILVLGEGGRGSSQEYPRVWNVCCPSRLSRLEVGPVRLNVFLVLIRFVQGRIVFRFIVCSLSLSLRLSLSLYFFRLSWFDRDQRS